MGMEVTSEKPYEVKRWYPYGYCIFFEKDTNLGFYLYRWNADIICGQLNGAYQLGYAKRASLEY